MNTDQLVILVEAADNIIKSADELLCDVWNEHIYGSSEWKECQRISNAILRVQQAIDLLKDEL